MKETGYGKIDPRVFQTFGLFPGHSVLLIAIAPDGQTVAGLVGDEENLGAAVLEMSGMNTGLAKGMRDRILVHEQQPEKGKRQ